MSRKHLTVTSEVLLALGDWQKGLEQKNTRSVGTPMSWNTFFLLITTDCQHGAWTCPTHYSRNRCRHCLELMVYD